MKLYSVSLFTAVFCVFIFFSCTTKRKFNSKVSDCFSSRGINVADTTCNELVKINLDKLPKVAGFSHSKIKHFYCVPLLFYYYSKERIECTINPSILVSVLKLKLFKALEDVYISERLAGKYLNIQFMTAPYVVFHDYKSKSWIHKHNRNDQLLMVSDRSEQIELMAGEIWLKCSVKNYIGEDIYAFDVRTKIEPKIHFKDYPAKRSVFVCNGLIEMNEYMDQNCEELVQLIIKEIV